MSRPRPGSAGRPAGAATPNLLLQDWYEAFLADTVRHTPRADDFPTNFTDFDYLWSTFQTSNRKLRSTVVELTDFERDTVLEYLRDQLGVLDFDNGRETVVWKFEALEKVTGDKPATQRRPWSQATNDWGAPVQTPKESSQVDDLFWGPAPAQGPVDPAWQISWSGDSPVSAPVRPAPTQKPAVEPWAKKAAASRPAPARSQPSSSNKPNWHRTKPGSRPVGVIELPPTKRLVKEAKKDGKKEARAPAEKKSPEKKPTAAPGKKDTVEERENRSEAQKAGKKAEAQAAGKNVAAADQEPKAASKKPAAKEEPPTWKAESSEKKGSGMALLGFDYL